MEQIINFIVENKIYIEYPLGALYLILLFSKSNKTSLVNIMTVFICMNLLMVLYFILGSYITTIFFCIITPMEFRKFQRLKLKRINDGNESGATS